MADQCGAVGLPTLIFIPEDSYRLVGLGEVYNCSHLRLFPTCNWGMAIGITASTFVKANCHVGVHHANPAYEDAVKCKGELDSDLAMAWRAFEQKAYYFLS